MQVHVRFNPATARWFVAGIREFIDYEIVSGFMAEDSEIVGFDLPLATEAMIYGLDCIDIAEGAYSFSVAIPDLREAIKKDMKSCIKEIFERICPSFKQVNAAMLICEAADAKLIKSQVKGVRFYAGTVETALDAISSVESLISYRDQWKFETNVGAIVDALNRISAIQTTWGGSANG
jgi:hypothetical protein